MADQMPNLELGKKRLEVQLGELRLNLLRMDVRIMELDDEKRRVLDNKEATLRAIAELEKGV